MPMTDVTREDLERAKIALSAGLGAGYGAVNEAVLQLAGYDPHSQYVPSLAEEAGAVAALAQQVPAPAMDDADADLLAAVQVAEIAGRAIIPFTARDGTIRQRYLVDALRANQAMESRAFLTEMPPGGAGLTAEEEAEVVRLSHVQAGLLGQRRPSYPVAALARNDREREQIALAARRVDEYVAELAADGSTRTYSTNGTTVTEVDTTDEGGATYTEEEILRYLNLQAAMMGQSPLVNDGGNRSYSPDAA